MNNDQDAEHSVPEELWIEPKRKKSRVCSDFDSVDRIAT